MKQEEKKEVERILKEFIKAKKTKNEGILTAALDAILGIYNINKNKELEKIQFYSFILE